MELRINSRIYPSKFSFTHMHSGSSFSLFPKSLVIDLKRTRRQGIALLPCAGGILVNREKDAILFRSLTHMCSQTRVPVSCMCISLLLTSHSDAMTEGAPFIVHGQPAWSRMRARAAVLRRYALFRRHHSKFDFSSHVRGRPKG